MDSQQARQRLECYRPGVDDEDPQFAEALAQTQRDPDLSRWFEQRAALDNVVRTKFGEIAAPAGLRERILAERKIVPVTAWWQNPFVLAAAAAAAMLAIVAGFLFQSRAPGNFGGFRQTMVQAVAGEYKMLLETNDLNQIHDFLAKNQAPSDYRLTPALRTTPAEGCSILNWHGHRVALLCFDLGHDNDLWMFVIDRSALPDAPASEAPQFASAGKMATATWSYGDELCLLVSKGDTEGLRKFL